MTKKEWAGFFQFLSVILVIWLLIDNEEKKKKIKELSLSLKATEGIDQQIKERLKELMTANPDIEPAVATELNDIQELIGIRQDSKAILAMAKVIENLLKKIYRTDAAFKARFAKRKPSFEDYLNYANEQKLISKEDFHHISIIKIYRNEEAHELAVKKDKNKVFSCMMSGIAIIYSLYSLLPSPPKQLVIE
ncbi:MAG: hypothetical protein V4456_16640 [Bacteroidota bacterium]